MMNEFFIILVSYIFLFIQVKPGEPKPELIQPSPKNISSDYCLEFNILHNKIRDSKIPQEEALRQIQLLLPEIKRYFYENGGKDFLEPGWFFPVQYYNSKAIGGSNGNGYVDSKYNFFDGNKHLGHPAQDIFVRDKNQDGLDDLTNKAVKVLSMTGGIVIATDTIWNPAGNLRGGKYLLIYDPYSNSFYYYAHNNEVFVQLCDIIKPGDVIATVGRTGMNAYKKRSPTHLHFMQLRLDHNSFPRPFNAYKSLIKESWRV